MTDIQNPGAVKPEAPNPAREALAELVASRDAVAAAVNESVEEDDEGTGYARRAPLYERHDIAWEAARAALELQPEPALTDEQLRESAQALVDHLWKTDLAGIPFYLVSNLRRDLLALGRGVPSSLLEKSEGSFHPVSTALEEKKP